MDTIVGAQVLGFRGSLVLFSLYETMLGFGPCSAHVKTLQRGPKELCDKATA